MLFRHVFDHCEIRNTHKCECYKVLGMAWIEVVPDEKWSDDAALESLYGRVVDKNHGRVDYIMSIHSLNPRALAAHDGLYRSAMAGTANLRKAERELIALVVSLENECHY